MAITIELEEEKAKNVALRNELKQAVLTLKRIAFTASLENYHDDVHAGFKLGQIHGMASPFLEDDRFQDKSRKPHHSDR